MDSIQLKREMKKLWKATFHDSDEYIEMIFENYFNPNMISFKEENGRLISALLGVPYHFSYCNSKIKAIYLCGLATLPEFRRRGIMESLIEDILSRNKNYYDMAFLIPANDGLEKYYNDRGFENAMFRIEERYTSVHDFRRSYFNYLNAGESRIASLKKGYFDSLNINIYSAIPNKGIIEEIIKFINEMEKNNTYPVLQHSKKDIELIIHDNIESHGYIIICRNRENKITGISFVVVDTTQIIIPKIYYSDNCSKYKLLQAAKHKYQDKSIVLYSSPENNDRKQLWSKTYIAQEGTSYTSPIVTTIDSIYKSCDHAKRYGMVRILNIVEILKFANNYQRGVKYSILVKQSGAENLIITVDEEGTHCQKIEANAIATYMEHNPTMTELTLKELQQLLFRRSHNSIISKATSIPRLPLEMSLMLD